MITKQQYVEYLVSTPINYTCTNLAEHLDGVSHDAVSDYLEKEKLTARHLWELVKTLIDDSSEACMIIDDSVHNKEYSRSIEMVKLQYSGAVGGLVRGIGVVNLVHTNGEDGEYYPVDFRVYAKEADGKTKNDHFQEMLLRAVVERQIKAKRVLFDSWYASWQNLKMVHRLGLIFYTTLKNNRLVSLSKESGYIHLDEIEWTEERLKNGNIDWVISNDLDEATITQVAQEANDLRWQVEEFHRELKQLTGSEKCQCRKARSQRNHLACCYHAWLSLKVQAKAFNKTIYRVHTDLFSDYLRAELRKPTVSAFQPA